MTDKQKEFLKLALIEGLTYDEIETRIKLSRKEFAPWWEELKTERLYLSEIRNKWKRKCPEIGFEDFKKWHESTKEECHYCHITEKDMNQLWQKSPMLTKRNRGKKLEIERLEPNLAYSKTNNLVYSCYWCNNAKTDTFTKDEFMEVGKVFQKIWQDRLK